MRYAILYCRPWLFLSCFFLFAFTAAVRGLEISFSLSLLCLSAYFFFAWFFFLISGSLFTLVLGHPFRLQHSLLCPSFLQCLQNLFITFTREDFFGLGSAYLLLWHSRSFFRIWNIFKMNFGPVASNWFRVDSYSWSFQLSLSSTQGALPRRSCSRCTRSCRSRSNEYFKFA